MSRHCLVTILITARNRPEELRHTLHLLRSQTYSPVELIVFDDASEMPLAPLVLRLWPHAVVIRNDHPKGLVANRSTGLRVARGEYIFSLDDDSCFTAPHDIERAVSRMESEPELGAMCFLVFHGLELHHPMPRPHPHYVTTFIGCGHVLRKSAIEKTGGYQDLYFYYGEEAELSLRLMDYGWRIWFFPDVLIHHRVSPINRNRSHILRYSMRNNLYTLILNMPLGRLLLQGAWRLFSHAWECIRLGEVTALCTGLAAFIHHLPHVVQMRRPIRKRTLDLYDTLQTVVIDNPVDYMTARTTFSALVCGFWKRYRNRPRGRNIFDSQPGDIGRSHLSVFAHDTGSDQHPMK